MRLVNDASRMSWVPHELVIKRTQNPLRHVLPKIQLTGPESDAWRWLEDIGWPSDTGMTNTWRDLRERAGEEGHTKQAIQKAQQFRKGSGA